MTNHEDPKGGENMNPYDYEDDEAEDTIKAPGDTEIFVSLIGRPEVPSYQWLRNVREDARDLINWYWVEPSMPRTLMSGCVAYLFAVRTLPVTQSGEDR